MMKVVDGIEIKMTKAEEASFKASLPSEEEMERLLQQPSPLISEDKMVLGLKAAGFSDEMVAAFVGAIRS